MFIREHHPWIEPTGLQTLEITVSGAGAMVRRAPMPFSSQCPSQKLTGSYHFSPRGSDAFFWPPWALNSHTHTPTQIHMLKNNHLSRQDKPTRAIKVWILWDLPTFFNWLQFDKSELIPDTITQAENSWLTRTWTLEKNLILLFC